MLKKLVLALPAMMICGCVNPAEWNAGVFALTPQGGTVQVADENIVRSCQYLGDVTGASCYSSSDIELARADARNQAGAMGATQIVFVSQTLCQVLGRAYRCPIPTQAQAPPPAQVQTPVQVPAQTPTPVPAQENAASSAHAAKVRAREEAAGAAANQAAPKQ